MLKIKRVFSDPTAFTKKCVGWKTTDAEIRNGDEIIHRQVGVKSPKAWSETAVNIVSSKYFTRGEYAESDVWDLVKRVTSTIAKWGKKDGYFDESNADTFYKELSHIMLTQRACFNSPVLFNVGLDSYGLAGRANNWNWGGEFAVECNDIYKHPQVSACFIQKVSDSMGSIMALAESQAMLFKYGSGTGTNFSPLRSERESLSGGGKPSGPLSFMRIYDQVAEVVRSGGVTRRAAAMRILNDTHPDIMGFINCKQKTEVLAKELLAGGHDPLDVYGSLPYQNANHSVRVSNQFMEAVAKNEQWQTYCITNGNVCEEFPAVDMWDAIAARAWECGDPGIQFHDTINHWNPCSNSDSIKASNPCSEYMFMDDSACNLASINLCKFVNNEGEFDVDAFRHTVRILIIAMDILIDNASYPTKKICENSHKYRPLGLGYTNLGAYLMRQGIPYDSDKGRELCSFITAHMQKAAIETSTDLAYYLEPFPAYDRNEHPVYDVLMKHIEACEALVPEVGMEEVLFNVEEYGLRNAQLTVLAPTGTISFLMDCDTTGIEPEMALVKTKQLVGGGQIRQVNKSVREALHCLEYGESAINQIVKRLEDTGKLHLSIQQHYEVFRTSLGSVSLPWEAHIKMMAAAQPFISGAISKTINMPNNATVDDVKDAFNMAYQMGLKSVTVYRDGSKGVQPVNVETDKEDESPPEEVGTPEEVVVKNVREKLPDTRDSITHKFTIDTHKGYFTVGLYPDGRPGEIFISVSKEGSTIGGLLDSLGISVSMGLQYGIPLKEYVDKFAHARFEPLGFTKNPDIRLAKSIVDYIFRWLDLRFNKKDADNDEYPDVYEGIIEEEPSMEAPLCVNCGAMTTLVGACHLCSNCGTSGGCS